MGICGSVPAAEVPQKMVSRSEEDDLRLSSMAQLAAKKRLSSMKVEQQEAEKLKEWQRQKEAAEELERSVQEAEERRLAQVRAQREEEEQAKAAQSKKEQEEKEADLQAAAAAAATAKHTVKLKPNDITAKKLADEAALEDARWAEREAAALSEKAAAAAADAEKEKAAAAAADAEKEKADTAAAEEAALHAAAQKSHQDKRDSMKQALLATSKRQALQIASEQAAEKAAEAAAHRDAKAHIEEESEGHHEAATEAAAIAEAAAAAHQEAAAAELAAAKRAIAAEEAPEAQAWAIKKCARNGSFFSAVQDRWLVLGHDGTMSYYKLSDADHENAPTYVKVGAKVKNTISNLRGASAKRWDAQFEAPTGAAVSEKHTRRNSKLAVSGDDSCTVMVHVPCEKDGSETLTCKFKTEEETADFLSIFTKHAHFYTNKHDPTSFGKLPGNLTVMSETDNW